jgi:hypothetical protein
MTITSSSRHVTHQPGRDQSDPYALSSLRWTVTDVTVNPPESQYSTVQQVGL